jgi:hypothetical protein
MDKDVAYFKFKLEETGLVDTEPLELVPTWQNNRGGSEGMSKRIDGFLVLESLMTYVDQIETWVEVIGFSNHSVILIQMEKHNDKPYSPLKINAL